MKFRELLTELDEAIPTSQVAKVRGILGKPNTSGMNKNNEFAVWKFKDGSYIEVNDTQDRIDYMDKNKKLITSYNSINQMKKALIQSGLLNEADKKQWKVLKDAMRAQQGFKSWEFEGDYEILIIGFKDNNTALEVSKKFKNMIDDFGSKVSVKNSKIEIELNKESIKALDESEDLVEGISNEAKEFMKKFNKEISFLKEDIKNSSTNSDWKHRLESISILIAPMIKKSVNEAKAKPYFGLNDTGKLNYAVQINGIENDFPTMPFGRQIEFLKKIKEFKDSAKKARVGAKGKATLAAVKSWVKENNPSEFYASWQKDSSSYKDDSVEIYFK